MGMAVVQRVGVIVAIMGRATGEERSLVKAPDEEFEMDEHLWP
jgi:hypothetical protein